MFRDSPQLNLQKLCVIINYFENFFKKLFNILSPSRMKSFHLHLEDISQGWSGMVIFSTFFMIPPPLGHLSPIPFACLFYERKYI
jgi:hypothetical protein